MGWRETANPAQLNPIAQGRGGEDPKRPETTIRTIADLKPGETAYTLPWAHNVTFPVEATPTGNKVMPVRRDGDGFVFMEPDWSVYDPRTAGLIAKYLAKSNSAHVRAWAAKGEAKARQPIMVTVDGGLNAETQEALRRACARGLVTPTMARDAFVSMVESTRAQNAALGTETDAMRHAIDVAMAKREPEPADTPPPRDGPTVEYKPARTTSPARDRFESKYGARPLPTNEPRPRRRWLWRTLYVVATLVTLAASVATLWQIYGG